MEIYLGVYLIEDEYNKVKFQSLILRQRKVKFDINIYIKLQFTLCLFLVQDSQERELHVTAHCLIYQWTLPFCLRADPCALPHLRSHKLMAVNHFRCVLQHN